MINLCLGPAAGDAGSSPGSGDSAAGAAGADHGSIAISRGGIIAIIVVAVSVCILEGKHLLELNVQGIAKV